MTFDIDALQTILLVWLLIRTLTFEAQARHGFAALSRSVDYADRRARR